MLNLNLICPSCETALILLDEDQLEHDDPLICIVCRALVVYVEADVEQVMTFNEEDPVREDVVVPAHLRRPSDTEETVMLGMPRVQQMIRIVADYHAEHGSPSPTLHPGDSPIPPPGDQTPPTGQEPGTDPGPSPY